MHNGDRGRRLVALRLYDLLQLVYGRQPLNTTPRCEYVQPTVGALLGHSNILKSHLQEEDLDKLFEVVACFERVIERIQERAVVAFV